MRDVYGIVAHPAAHTLSPVLYEAGFAAAGIDAEFRVFDVAPGDDLADFFKRVRCDIAGGWHGVDDGGGGRADLSGVRGFAISLPHKETVCALLDSQDAVATRVGAVNTVRVVRRGGGGVFFEGFNTDVAGVRYALDDALTSFKWRPVLVVGAGGAARAVVAALIDIGARIFITNRHGERADELARAVGAGGGVQCIPYDVLCAPYASYESLVARGEIPAPFDLVINATSVGLERDESPLPIYFWEFCGNGFAFDAVCRAPVVARAPMTRFLCEADRAGWRTIAGDRMLIGQAAPQFELLTGRSVNAAVFVKALENFADVRR